MTDEIPLAAYAFVDKLALTETDGTFSHRTAAARLAHENGLVPKPDVSLLAVKATILAYGARPGDHTYEASVARALSAFNAELTKHNYAVVKVATDEERLIEARKLCAKVAVELGSSYISVAYRQGTYDHRTEMIAMLAALKARDGVK